MQPGEYLLKDDPIPYHEKRKTIQVQVINSGDRPIQIGSHYHFAETNSMLLFDRTLALGFRLNIPAGTALRFEPGQTRKVELVALPEGARIYGFQAQVMGPLAGET